MNNFDINCDLGEGFDNEEELMPFIQSCNIACGAHAGNAGLMYKMVLLALKYQVNIGAHPSYPDQENFGRVSMKMKDNLFVESIQNQIDILASIIHELGGRLNHIKPHGALYNDLIIDAELALKFLKSINKYKKKVKLVVPFGSTIEKMAIKLGFAIIYEAFADRNYNDDLSLVSRSHIKAIISNEREIMRRTFKMINNSMVRTISGREVNILAETICVHSDSPNAIKIVKLLDRIKKEQILQ